MRWTRWRCTQYSCGKWQTALEEMTSKTKWIGACTIACLPVAHERVRARVLCVLVLLYGIYSIQFSPVVLKPLAHCMALFNATLMSFLPFFCIRIYARRRQHLIRTWTAFIITILVWFVWWCCTVRIQCARIILTDSRFVLFSSASFPRLSLSLSRCTYPYRAHSTSPTLVRVAIISIHYGRTRHFTRLFHVQQIKLIQRLRICETSA